MRQRILLENKVIPVVNFHLWKPCNYKCKFCFATFDDFKAVNLKKEEALNIIEQISVFGFEKITFSGGEPLLCPYIEDLLELSKQLKLVTTIVSNGSLITDAWITKNHQNIDWFGLSIDSLSKNTNKRSGRSGKMVFDKNSYIELINLIKKHDIKLKINTVVSNYNKNEDMNSFINYVKPKRWKIFQALPIKGQNDFYKADFIISTQEFEAFLERHKTCNFIKENNDHMKGSYVMIDPKGRFFENTNGTHKYSKKINDVGINNAFKEMNYSFNKFIDRHGIYNW